MKHEYVAIVGSRQYADLDAVRRYVEQLKPSAVVVSGCAAGVDSAARAAASRRGLFVVDVPVLPNQWEMHGRRAGPLRNEIIASLCDRMVAFWDGTSRGTRSAIEAALREGKAVEIIKAEVSV